MEGHSISVAPEKKEEEKKDKDDFALSGMFFTFGLLAVIGLLIYLLTIQTNASKCKPVYDEKGDITNNCYPDNAAPTPIQEGPGNIQFLDNLKPKSNTIPELDGQ